MILFRKIDTSRLPSLTKAGMFLLALTPIINVYQFPYTSLPYTSFFAFILFIISILKGKLRKNPYAICYLLFWAYAAFQVYFISNDSFSLDCLPGGILVFIFSISLAAFVVNFDYNCLRKYIRLIWTFAAVLFIFQFLLFTFAGYRISVFLPLGNSLTYENFTYHEMIQQQLSFESNRFCSIFAEPSYFAMYSLIAFAFELFCDENKNRLYTPLAIVMCVVIILIRSGIGFAGIALMACIKMLYLLFVSRKIKYLLYMSVLIPVVVFIVQIYMNSSMGQKLMERSIELDMNAGAGTSGFARIFYGYTIFEGLSPFEQLLGASRTFAYEIHEKGFVNGISDILFIYGYVGVFFVLLFYLVGCYKKSIAIISIALLFIGASFIESTFLSPLMLISATVVSAKTLL